MRESICRPTRDGEDDVGQYRAVYVLGVALQYAGIISIHASNHQSVAPGWPTLVSWQHWKQQR